MYVLQYAMGTGLSHDLAVAIELGVAFGLGVGCAESSDMAQHIGLRFVYLLWYYCWRFVRLVFGGVSARTMCPVMVGRKS